MYQKFKPEDDKVVFSSFTSVCQAEPEILEFFDYFNNGIVDSIGPVASYNQKQIMLLEELQAVTNKLVQMKDFLSGMTDDLDFNNNNRKKTIITVPTRNSINPTSKNSIPDPNKVFHRLDSNIRRTLFFIPLQEESGIIIINEIIFR